MYVSIKDYSLLQSIYSIKADLIMKNKKIKNHLFYLKYKIHILEDNKTLYDYLKNNKSPFSFEPFYKSSLKDIEIILNKHSAKNKILDAIEKDFNEYNNIVNQLEINNLNYGIFNIYEKLVILGEIDIIFDLEYSDKSNIDDTLDLIYRQPIRRGTE